MDLVIFCSLGAGALCLISSSPCGNFLGLLLLQFSLPPVILAAGNPVSSNDHCFLSPIAVAIAKSVDSYLATSFARLIYDSGVLMLGIPRVWTDTAHAQTPAYQSVKKYEVQNIHLGLS